MVHHLPVEVIHTDWVYQTTIDDIKVTVRKCIKQVDSDAYDYIITVERTGRIVTSKYHDDQTAALNMADIMRDIYAAKLEEDLLWH